MVAAEARKAESASEGARLDTQTPVPNWETGLQPLNVREKEIGNATNTLPQQVVENCEGWVSRAWNATKGVH